MHKEAMRIKLLMQQHKLRRQLVLILRKWPRLLERQQLMQLWRREGTLNRQLWLHRELPKHKELIQK